MRSRVGIVGHGFVGQAVSNALDEHNQIILIDPKYKTVVSDLIPFNPEFVFICAPTPMNDDGSVNGDIVATIALEVSECIPDAIIVVKSTITPQVVSDIISCIIPEQRKTFVYNPEFLTERNAKDDFINAEYHVIGGDCPTCEKVADLYQYNSKCSTTDFRFMSAPEASFVKYGMNAFLATKVTFFNQLSDLVNLHGCDSTIVTNTIGLDKRIGSGHTMTPGSDGKKGFGGACLPKDTNALLDFSEGKFDLLNKVLTINNEYRIMYTVDEREKINNIKFGDK